MSVEQAISCVIAVGDTDNITAYVIPHSTYALQADFQAHLDDTNNPHHVTLAQLGAAAEDHTHTAADVTDGIFPIERGGTGVNTLEALRNLLSLDWVIGFYTGDGAMRHNIPLGFRPSRVVIVETMSGNPELLGESGWSTVDARDNSVNVYNRPHIFYIEPGKNLIHSGCPQTLITADADTLFAKGHGGAAVTDSGFAVGYYKELTRVNKNGVTYMYLAWK